jgi:hypothetical protein
MSGICYGKTVAGKHCELPGGHYPATHHRISLGGSWMAWTDESMAEFARIADEMEHDAG